MSQELWTKVDEFFASKLMPADPVLEAALRSSEQANLPPIAVSPAQGKFLHLLARAKNARKILEVGTLGGYSTIWLGRGLAPGGKLISLELQESHARVARANVERAGLSQKVEIIVAPALETLPKLAAQGAGPFDLVFIDADKPSNADYFSWAMKLSDHGTIIVVDNVVRKGAVTNLQSDDADVKGVQRCVDAIQRERRISATVLQSVGVKGYDGLIVGVVE